VRVVVIALVAAAAFGAVDWYLGSLGAHPWGAARSLSAPWLVLPFLLGATQRVPRRGALLGLAGTYAALLGYALMIAVEDAHLTPAMAGHFFAIEHVTFLAALGTGPLFGWFGQQWRTRRALFGALVTAAALSLEPLARRASLKPIRFEDVAIAEIVAGLMLAAYVAATRRAPRSSA
jgi:uncharacterized protein DUF6518